MNHPPFLRTYEVNVIALLASLKEIIEDTGQVFRDLVRLCYRLLKSIQRTSRLN